MPGKNLKSEIPPLLYLTKTFVSFNQQRFISFTKIINHQRFSTFTLMFSPHSGWPCVVEAVGSWFPEGRRGFVMGVWNTHVSVGNILGSLIAGAFVKHQWGLSFIVPGAIIAGLGIVVFLFLIPDPAHVYHDESHHSHHVNNPDLSPIITPHHSHIDTSWKV